MLYCYFRIDDSFRVNREADDGPCSEIRAAANKVWSLQFFFFQDTNEFKLKEHC